jgi:hypothetical protein
MAQWLLNAGADANERASLKKGIRFSHDPEVAEYRNVTPLGWGRQFHCLDFASSSAMAIIVEQGGVFF